MYRRKTLYAVEAPNGACFVEGSRVSVICKDGRTVSGEVMHVGATTLLIDSSEFISIAMDDVVDICSMEVALGGKK